MFLKLWKYIPTTSTLKDFIHKDCIQAKVLQYKLLEQKSSELEDLKKENKRLDLENKNLHKWNPTHISYIDNSLLQYKTREKQTVDYAEIDLPYHPLRNEESDLHAITFHTTTITLYNEKEAKKSRKAHLQQHQKEQLQVKIKNLKDLTDYLELKGIKHTARHSLHTHAIAGAIIPTEYDIDSDYHLYCETYQLIWDTLKSENPTDTFIKEAIDLLSDKTKEGDNGSVVIHHSYGWCYKYELGKFKIDKIKWKSIQILQDKIKELYSEQNRV